LRGPRWAFTKSRDGGGAEFSVTIDITFSFATAMVVSRLPAGCCVDASASRPLDSASVATSAYQRPAASCPLANFFPFASVCWLVIASPLVAPPPPYVAFCHTAASPVHPRPPLFVRAGWLLRRILSHRLRAPPADMLPRAAPSPYIRQLTLSCTQTQQYA